jgi:CheY-like chemotaxis protein
MKRQGRILALDDHPRWREVLNEVLSAAGFLVDTADSIEETLRLLDSSFYHLLVLDISMSETVVDDEGLRLLEVLQKHGYAEAAGVIMLTGHGTQEKMRTAFRDYKVVDFLTKQDFDDRTFVQQVQQFFAANDRFPINLDLDVHWQPVNSREQVFQTKRFGGQRISRDTPELAARAVEELDDLLCRLFHNANNLLVQPLTGGHSDAGVLWVLPFYPDGGGRAAVVKFGDAREIDVEYDNFRDYVQPFIGGGHSTTILRRQHTPRLGGIIYSLLGTVGDRADDFGTFYHQASVEHLIETLERLFFDICASWYASRSRLQLHDLTAEYEQTLRLSPARLESIVAERLKGVQGKHRLTFRALDSERTFSNPIIALGSNPLLRPTYTCTTHGDFNSLNIMVDTTRHAWLIDFLRTGPGHILRDVALLDAVIRIQLLGEKEATLAERLALEEALNGPTHFADLAGLPATLATENPALAKAYAISRHLRDIAHRLVQPNPSGDMSEFYIATLYHTLNMLRFYGLPVIQREHALLSASLLVDRL